MTSYIDQLFPNPLATPEEMEARYPVRDLPEGAMVTRIAPSPTGFMHIGTVYVGRLCALFSKQSGGVSILRIEDTDKKREVEGAVDFIINSFEHFGIEFDEGVTGTGTERGDYGPYTQSHRKEIYHTFVKHLVKEGKAYPCFASTEQLDEIRRQQELSGQRTGYYGRWARWRDRSEEDILKALDEGKDFVIRFKATGSHAEKLHFEDELFGKRRMPENDMDIVIMKSDGLPTYHFAHIVDDHLMRTTHVIRGDEWLVSVPLHLQMFEAMGWDAPAYAHIAPINKMDDTARRKLSKRKDPEASVHYFEEQGYAKEPVLDYLLNLANSAFETWKNENPDVSSDEYPLTLQGLKGSSGPLFDFEKLGHLSRNHVASLTSQEVYDQVIAWADKHDEDLAALMRLDPERVLNILSIEREGVTNVRKDIEIWSDVKGEVAYYFDRHFNLDKAGAMAHLDGMSEELIKSVIEGYWKTYDPADDKDAWFAKIKELAGAQGFAVRGKDFKKNPDDYHGTIGHMVKIFRVALTGRPQSPDLYSVMKVMGDERVRARLGVFG